MFKTRNYVIPANSRHRPKEDGSSTQRRLTALSWYTERRLTPSNGKSSNDLTLRSALPFHRDATETVPTTDLDKAQKALKDISLHFSPSPPKPSDSPESLTSVIRIRDRRSLIFEVGPFFAHGQERLSGKRVELSLSHPPAL